MRIGIVDYLLRVRDEASFFLAQELGFECLELSTDHASEPNPLLQANGDKELADLMSTSGVRISAVQANHCLRENLLHSDPYQRQAGLLALQGLAELLGKLSVPVLTIPLFGASELQSEAELLAFQDVLAQLASWVGIHQVTLAFKSTLPAAQAVALLQRFESPWLGVCFDPANAIVLGHDPIAEIHTLGPMLRHVHLKDRQRDGAAVSLGAGQLDLPAVLSTLLETRYEGDIILVTPVLKSAIESAKHNLAIVRECQAA